MATTQQIGGNGTLFAYEDKTFYLGGPPPPPFLYPVVDQFGNLVDMTSWTIEFVVNTRDDSPNAPLISQIATIIGIFNASPALNTQQAQVIVSETVMAQFA